MIQIFCLDISTKCPSVKLPKKVVAHINKYTNLAFKKISKLGWSTLIDLLSEKFKINFKKDKICFSKFGRPYLKSNKLFFSLSHSLNLIALAISDNPIGVDIEKLIPLNLCSLIAKKILNKEQIKQYKKSSNKSLFLTKIWTQKESMIKLTDSSILNISQLSKIKTQNNVCELVDSKNNKYVLAYSK